MKKRITMRNFPLSELPGKIIEIVNYYNDAGFMFARAELDSIQFIEPHFYAFLTISEDEYINIKEFLFKGNEHSTENSLLKIGQLENVNYLNPAILKQAEDRISNRPYIKKCNLYLLDHETLLIEVEEDRMTFLSGVLGYNNRSNNTRSFNGFLDIRFLNLFGSDRSLGLNWQNTASDINTIALTYHESGPAGIPLNADFILTREEVDSTYIRSELTSEIYYYQFYNKYGVSASINTIYPGSRRPKLVARNDLTKAGLFWEYSNVFTGNPLTGNQLRIGYYNVFYKKNKTSSSRQQTDIFGSTFINVSGKNVLALRLNARAMENKDLESYELFSLGGKDDLRGYAEDQFKGHVVFWSNLEFRYLLSYSSRVFAFFDYGFVQKYESRSGKLFGTGIGLRFNTKLGLLGIDYGIGYENGKFRNPLDGIVHFGLETKL